MKRAPLVRVAFIKYSPCGKVYCARCERTDICVGNLVEVLSSDGAYLDAEVVDIAHHRWSCKDTVVNLASEVHTSIGLDEDGSLMLERVVSSARKSLRLVHSAR
jgi:hypothetical protein